MHKIRIKCHCYYFNQQSAIKSKNANNNRTHINENTRIRTGVYTVHTSPIQTISNQMSWFDMRPFLSPSTSLLKHSLSLFCLSLFLSISLSLCLSLSLPLSLFLPLSLSLQFRSEVTSTFLQGEKERKRKRERERERERE